MIQAMRITLSTRGHAGRNRWRICLAACLIVASLVGIEASAGQARLENAYDLIAAVNQLRSANNLPPYETSGALMAAAQAHSDYQAAIGSVTHTGKGGTRPRDRAAAAGYGGGAAIYVSENIAGGTSMSVQRAVQMWQGDSLHLNTMLGASYTHAGAGVSSDGSMTYITLDVGYIAGQPGSGSSGSGTGSATRPPGSPAPTAVAFFPVQAATAMPDGSVIHEVQPGQSLWSIAAVYKVNLPELLQLNGLSNNAFIYPGDKIIVKPSQVAATAEEEPDSEEVESTPTRRPSLTPTRPATQVAALLPTQAVAPTKFASAAQQVDASQIIQDPLLLFIALLVFGGTALIIIGNALKQRA